MQTYANVVAAKSVRIFRDVPKESPARKAIEQSAERPASAAEIRAVREAALDRRTTQEKVLDVVADRLLRELEL